ncbi:MAG: hypothetical protein U0T11_03215 [Chitinophagaceae bacterium]
MKCNSTIPVKDLFDTTLHTRDAAKQLLEWVEKDLCDHVELDFTDIDYISRSFADQFHAEKLELISKTNKTILVTNGNEDVIRMLQAVANTQNKKNRSIENIQVYNFTDWKILERFLLSI